MRLRLASIATWASVSCSDSPSGRSSSSRRSERGMSTSRSSMVRAPMVSSIAVRSSGEWTRYGKLVRRLLRHLLVRRLVEQVARKLAFEVELQDPALAVRVGVDELRLAGELFVDRADPAGHRRVEVARRFHRLDDAEALARRQLAARAGKLEEHHVTELRLREIRDPDRGLFAVDRDPLV